MSTLKTTNITHPSATSNNIVLASDGSTTISSLTATTIQGTIKSGTAQASTSGTSIDFTGIPSWVKRITVMFQGVSTNGSSQVIIRLGTSSGFVSTAGAYLGSADDAAAAISPNSMSTGFTFEDTSEVSTLVRHGLATLCNLSGNNWVYSFIGGRSDAAGLLFGGGSISAASLGGTLDRIRITTVNGTDTFDAGSINILYEG